MSNSDAKTVEALEEKMKKLFLYEKELNKAIKETNTDVEEIRTELNRVYKKIEELSNKFEEITVAKANSTRKRYKSLTNKDFYHLKVEEGMSWSELSKFAQLSTTSCKRRVQAYREEMFKDMEV